MDSTGWSIRSILLLIFIVIPSCLSLDTIRPNQPLRDDGDVLVSSRKIFALGFFSPGNVSHNRYVGVWYNQVPNQTVVWVANRDNPVNDTSGLLTIDGNGGLVIYGKDQNIPIWSANVTLSSPNSSVVKLLDTGNLVLLEDEVSQNMLWESFDYPTDTMLPFMKIGLNRRSGLNRFLTSWKSQDDPGTGSFSYRINPSGFPQMIVYKGTKIWWRAGSCSGVSNTTPDFIFNTTFENNQDELTIMYGVSSDSVLTKTVLQESGIIQRTIWKDRWTSIWSAPADRCDYYGKCGPNSNCDPSDTNSFQCTCLPGYEPKSPADWSLKDGSGGCVIKNGASMCRNGEGFLNMEPVKVPESSMARVNMNLSLKACKEECLRDCSCTAYSIANHSSKVSGCVTWHGDLMDMSNASNFGPDLFVRVDSTVLAQYAKKSNGSVSKNGKLAISLASVLVFFLVIFFVHWLVKKNRKDKEIENNYVFRVTTRPTYFQNTSPNLDDESRINSKLPFFDLRTIAAATNNFSFSNKLGAGGFGSVYKGVLSNGNEVAVKRLSKNSGQGIKEFKNEVELIAKLQHRNLVRIIGCCVKDEEKMLIYEYLPNKSLDFFIFNEKRRSLLDWTRRFEIICGIARGLLYLHQDSRLRIIHRDLKASNVLLDASMNPKISDFGMARIFKGDQNEASTNRVVGTYGYMSPEYAMEGLFSAKSDVYSFGILVLEIITGRKNTGYYHEENPNSNLVGHVWNLWRVGTALEIVDSSLGESYLVNEVLRCFQIALLCVQDYATDRPTMSAVLVMLSNDAALATPREPAFVFKRTYTGGDPSTSTTEGAKSYNDVTCTIVEAR